MENILGKDKRKFWMGFSIIWIFVFHLLYFFPKADEIPTFLNHLVVYGYKGWIGVDIFIFLSTYGLCHSFNRNSLRRFYLNRFKRIVPIYIPFFLIVIFIFKPWTGVDDMACSFIKQLSGLSVVKVLDPDVEWFTPAIMAIYILFPLIYLCLMKIKGMIWEFMLIVVCVMTTNITAHWIDNHLTARFPIIIMGILTYKYLNGKDDKRGKQIFGLYALTATMVLGTLNSYVKYVVLVPLLLYGLNTLPVSKRLTRLFVFIGEYSFEIYLSQVITTYYMLRHQLCITNGFWQMLEIIIYTIVLSIILGLVSRCSKNMLGQKL